MTSHRQSWPIGYARPGIEIEATFSGVVLANGEPVTDASGWMSVPSPHADVREARDRVEIRLHVARDGSGEPCLYARDARIGARTYAGLHDLAVAEGLAWISYIPRAVLAEITQRAAASQAISRRIVIAGRGALVGSAPENDSAASRSAPAASGSKGRRGDNGGTA